MTDFSIHKLKITALTILLGLLPLGCATTAKLDNSSCVDIPENSNCIEISRWSTNWKKGKEVTLKVKVLNQDRLAITTPLQEYFVVKTEDASGNPLTLKPPQITVIPPDDPEANLERANPEHIYIVMLLDMSGSMKHQDESGEKKLDGAIAGIKEFIAQSKKDKLNVNISINPFGYAGGKCDYSFEVSEASIKEFRNVTKSQKLEEYLNKLAETPVCAATNIYAPLKEAIRYLGTPDRFKFKSPPQLAVILFSDGFHNFERESEQEQFDELLAVIQQNPHIIVHTLGYGKKLKYLVKDIQCPVPGKVTVDKVLEYCTQKKSDIAELIVDEERLTKIAKVTGGSHQFPVDAKQLAKDLKDILMTLKEYTIIYDQPEAERAKKYKTVVILNAPYPGLEDLASNPNEIRLPHLGFIFPSLPGLFMILAIIILLILAGVIPFIIWIKKLKNKAKLF